MTDKYVSVPVELTAENGAKAALMGEFFERLEMGCADCSGGVAEGDLCESCEGAGELIYKVPVSWSTIKAIWKKSIEAVAAPEPASAEPVVMPYLLRKGGMWYAHNSSGYTVYAELAEIYEKDYAELHAIHHGDVSAIPLNEIIASAEQLDPFIERMQAMQRALNSIQQEPKS